MVAELITAIILTLMTPFLAPILTLHAYEIDSKYFKTVKIKKLSFLFCGIGGKTSVYGDVRNNGVIIPFFTIQTIGYILTILQVILIPILYVVVKIEYVLLIVIGGVFVCHIITVIATFVTCYIISNKRKKKAQQQNFFVDK